MEDERFAHVKTDPKFRRIPNSERKIKIDKRFQFMFNDKRFKVKYTTDKRGRPVNHSTLEDLKRYYELLEDNSSESEEEEETTGEYVKAPKSEEGESESESNEVKLKHKDNSSESEEEVITGKYVKAPKSEQDESENESNEVKIKHKSDKQISEKVKNKLKNLNVDYARGEGYLCSESSSDDESEEEDSDRIEVEHKWGELDADAERTAEATCRLAACNMDWDRIRAMDLMVLFSSFLSQNNYIHSVSIYPSDFGLQRMKEEEINGPSELVENKLEEEINEDETEEGAKYHMEKLREYQLNRLKYYYAVITCDSANTANKIYTECDGLEYESSATKIDLRFIPDDMMFDAEPKEICEKLPNMEKYQPRFFTTTALQQAKVDLTWDETDPERIEVTQKLAAGKIDDVSEADLQTYLASSSEEEDDAENKTTSLDLDNDVNPIDKYRTLLSEMENREKEKEKEDIQMEVTWGINLEKKTEELIKKSLSDKANKTPFQEYLDKRKEKQKQKYENRKKENKHSSDESDVPSDVDLNDPYFAEEFNKPEFKQKKQKKGNLDEDEQEQVELQLLISDEDDNKKHFSLKRILEQESESKLKKRRRKQKEYEKTEDNFEIKVSDERFSALFTSHHFNIDPTDPHFRKTNAMNKLLEEKHKRRSAEDVPEPINDNNNTYELNALVKSVKRKARNYNNNKK